MLEDKHRSPSDKDIKKPGLSPRLRNINRLKILLCSFVYRLLRQCNFILALILMRFRYVAI